MDNDLYNLMKATVKKAQSISKYGRYLEDSVNCPECKTLWKKLRTEDMAQLEEMKAVFRKVHLPKI